MLKQLLKMYYAAMLYDVRSVIPHLAGPPGVGKSAVVNELGNIVGKRVHKINVSRISPLEIEGVQMPVNRNTELKLLLSTLWSKLKEGDIVLFDEFLRGFPEVYNGLLDIISEREVAGHKLPKVFFVAASNSVTTYDSALEDRLMHIFVPDIRKDFQAMREAKDRFITELGLYPKVKAMPELSKLFELEISPMYNMLDQFKGHATQVGAATASTTGHSARNLAGQVRLREIQSVHLKDVLSINNRLAIQDGKHQYVVLPTGLGVDPEYARAALKLDKESRSKLTPVQSNNLTMNLQLIEMEQVMAGNPSTEVGEEINA